MTSIDDLQVKANAAADALDAPDGTVAELVQDNTSLAETFAGLGQEHSAQVLYNADSLLATVREHLANARTVLEEYVAACEQAKGTGGG